MLELVIAVVVAFIVGLLIGITSMSQKARVVEQRRETVHAQFTEFMDTAYDDVNLQINLVKYSIYWQMDNITNAQRKRLRQLGSKLLRIKDKDEDHPDSVEGQ